MIYFKKKSWIKKVFNIRKRVDFISLKKKSNFSFFKFLKGLFVFLMLCLTILYTAYLCLLPRIIKEKDVENILNSFLDKNTKLSLDIDNFKINPNYKFDLNVKANKIRLIYPDKSNFIVINNLNSNVNLISLLFKKLDINKVDMKSFELNTSFSNKYECFNCINLDIFNKKSKIPLAILKVNIEDFNINIFDKNVDKMYIIKANKLKLNKFSDDEVHLNTFGTIKQKNKTIVDFKSNLSIELKEKTINKLKHRLLSLNYNPFLYADKYNFYLNSDINLRYNPNKNTLNGYIDLKDFTFSYLNFNIPKNNLVINFKNNNIYTNCKLNLIKNQFINLEVKAKPNKFIEAKVLSSDIDLNDFSKILKTFLKIANVNYDFNNIDLKGKLKADIYLKSNFKTLTSSGTLNIIDTKLIMKKPYFVINNINSNVNFANNIINIINTHGFVNNEKFYIKGTIDNNTNLNLDIHSSDIDIARFLGFVKNLPIMPINYKKDLDKISIQKGILKISAKIKGTLKEPSLISNSKIYSLKAYLKQYSLNVLINEIKISAYPKPNNIGDINVIIDKLNCKNKDISAILKNLNLTIKEDDIVSNDFKIDVQTKNLKLKDAKVKSIIKNYSDKPTVIADIKGKIPASNNLFKIKGVSNFYDFNLNSTVVQNKLTINNAQLLSKNVMLAQIIGSINNFQTNPDLNIKLLIPNKLSMILYNPDLKFDIQGSANITKTLKNPSVDGSFAIQNLFSKSFGLKVADIILNIKNSSFKVNISNGNLFNNDFSLVADMLLNQNKLIIPYLKFNSNYINLDTFLNYQNNLKTTPMNYEILDLKGYIQTIDSKDFTLSALNFKGKLKNDVLNIDSYRANLYDGEVDGKLSYNLKTNKVHTTTLLKGIGIRHFSNQLKAFSIAASGRLSSMVDIDFYFNSNYNALVKSAKGYVKFNIDDGELNHFAKLERFLQAGNILSQSILKLNLNSMLSTVTKQNTGYFKTIEGTIKIADAKGDIQYIKTIGQNMSMYIKGNYDILTNNASIKVLGRIPLNIVSVMGNVGKVSIEDIVNKMGSEDKKIIDNVTKSPLELVLTSKIPISDVDKVPNLLNKEDNSNTRLFSVVIKGDVTKVSSIKSFRWIEAR